MTHDEIIEMAREAGLDPDLWNYTDAFERFAFLVALNEREACAKVVETLWDTPTNGMATEEQFYGNECAKVIRARGQA